MGLFMTEKEETKSNNCNKMGLLLVFFPDNNGNKHGLLSSPSSSSSVRRTKSSSFLLSKAQVTISICAIFVFLTLFVFTLSTFEPPNTATSHHRFLFRRNARERRQTHARSVALQGMGILYLRGTRAMHDLVVAHVGDDVIEDDLRLFLRLIHRSGITSRSDVALIFGSGLRFDGLIREENDSFLKLVDAYRRLNSTNRSEPVLGFEPTRFLKHQGGETETGDPLWGKRAVGSNRAGNESAENETESTRLSYGSVVGFDASELDPENSLSGFLDHVPISLRRWACYPMLLGRVRHSFKHVTLVDARNALFLSDPLTRMRNRGPESVLVFRKQQSKKNSDRSQPNSVINSAVLIGGAKGIRRLSNAMLTEVVRAAMQDKKKSSVSETMVLSQLVGKVHITKSFEAVEATESVPDTSSLAGLRSRNSGTLASLRNHDVILRGNSNHRDMNSVIMKHICSYELDSSVYSDC